MNSYYPGCSLADYFAKPAIKLWSRSNKSTYHEYFGTKISMKYNGQGYRTHEFSSELGDYFLAVGDSQTEGIGLHSDQTYIDKLEKKLGIPGINLGLGSSDSEFMARNIATWVTSWPTKPRFVIAQWPQGIVRMFQHMENHLIQFYNVHNANEIHKNTLKQSIDNFLNRWLSAVVDTNNLLAALDIKVINLCLSPQHDLDSVQPILDYLKIKIHTDWVMDQRAYDRAHAGDECHTWWADRILTLYNEINDENTTR